MNIDPDEVLGMARLGIKQYLAGKLLPEEFALLTFTPIESGYEVSAPPELKAKLDSLLPQTESKEDAGD